jgi:hypothetical protein
MLTVPDPVPVAIFTCPVVRAVPPILIVPLVIPLKQLTVAVVEVVPKFTVVEPEPHRTVCGRISVPDVDDPKVILPVVEPYRLTVDALVVLAKALHLRLGIVTVPVKVGDTSGA